MHIREIERIDEFPEAATTWAPYYRYYMIYEFDLGDGRVVLAEVEPDDARKDGVHFIAGIMGVFDSADHSRRLGSLYDVAQAAEIIAELQRRNPSLDRIFVTEADRAPQLDVSRLKGAP